MKKRHARVVFLHHRSKCCAAKNQRDPPEPRRFRIGAPVANCCGGYEPRGETPAYPCRREKGLLESLLYANREKDCECTRPKVSALPAATYARFDFSTVGKVWSQDTAAWFVEGNAKRNCAT
jgi:hypothetical protein